MQDYDFRFSKLKQLSTFMYFVPGAVRSQMHLRIIFLYALISSNFKIYTPQDATRSPWFFLVQRQTALLQNTNEIASSSLALLRQWATLRCESILDTGIHIIYFLKFAETIS